MNYCYTELNVDFYGWVTRLEMLHMSLEIKKMWPPFYILTCTLTHLAPCVPHVKFSQDLLKMWLCTRDNDIDTARHTHAHAHILPVQFTCLTVFLHSLCPKFYLVYLLVWYPPLHTPYISSPNHCRLFAAHAHLIATCVAVVLKLYYLHVIMSSEFINFMPLPLTISCCSKSRNVLPFCYWLTRVVPDKGLLNGCCCC